MSLDQHIHYKTQLFYVSLLSSDYCSDMESMSHDTGILSGNSYSKPIQIGIQEARKYQNDLIQYYSSFLKGYLKTDFKERKTIC
jgi:hypothetical protein